jgi:hypothetical protein
LKAASKATTITIKTAKTGDDEGCFVTLEHHNRK